MRRPVAAVLGAALLATAVAAPVGAGRTLAYSATCSLPGTDLMGDYSYTPNGAPDLVVDLQLSGPRDLEVYALRLEAGGGTYYWDTRPGPYWLGVFSGRSPAFGTDTSQVEFPVGGKNRRLQLRGDLSLVSLASGNVVSVFILLRNADNTGEFTETTTCTIA